MLPSEHGLPMRGALGLRRPLPEIMDDPRLAAQSLERALRAIARINALSATARSFWRRAQRLMNARGLRRLRILDLGCGDANVAIRMATLAARSGCSLEIVACDRSPVAVNAARRLAARRGVLDFEAISANAVTDDLGAGYDVVISSLFLHHLTKFDAERLLRRIPRLARHGAWMDDLCRSPRGYRLAWWGTRLLTRSPVVRYDGPASVCSAWTPEEALSLARQAGLRDARVERRWPERFTLTWEASGHGVDPA